MGSGVAGYLAEAVNRPLLPDGAGDRQAALWGAQIGVRGCVARVYLELSGGAAVLLAARIATHVRGSMHVQSEGKPSHRAQLMLVGARAKRVQPHWFWRSGPPWEGHQ